MTTSHASVANADDTLGYRREHEEHGDSNAGQQGGRQTAGIDAEKHCRQAPQYEGHDGMDIAAFY
jgi:hypothetical protein